MAAFSNGILYLITITTILAPTAFGNCKFDSSGLLVNRNYNQPTCPANISMVCTGQIVMPFSINCINQYGYEFRFNIILKNAYAFTRDDNEDNWQDPIGQKSRVMSVNACYNAMSFLPSVIFNFRELELLNVSHNNLARWSYTDFQKIPSLVNLDLSYNSFDSLDSSDPQEIDDPTNYFTQLVTLNLKYNKIRIIPENFFKNLNRLDTLDLSHNMISVLDSSSFSGLIKITYLDISYNHIVNLNLALMRLNTLTELYLNDNDITSLNSYDFMGLNKLTHVTLNNNELQHTLDLFNSLKSLIYLNLSYNKIIQVSKQLFSSNEQIVVLDLSYNHIKTIEKGAFIKNSFLTDLDLGGNQLEGSLVKGQLEGLTKVITLNMSHHRLSQIDNFAFVGMTDLLFLNISDNVLSSVSRSAFKTLHNLKTLDLSGNKLTEIIFDTSNLEKLLWFSLRNNKLSTVSSEVIENLVSLDYFDISHNNFVQLESETFKHLQHLKHLQVGINPLTGDITEKTFHNLESLPLLDLSYTNICSVNNNSFYGMKAMLIFNISHSNLSKIEYNAFSETGGLRVLDASYNILTIFLVNNSQIANLEELILRHNSIININSNTLGYLYNVKIIDLSKNKLTIVENNSFKDLFNLTFLDMAFNELCLLNVSCFEHLPLLTDLSLSGTNGTVYSQMIGFKLKRLALSSAHITDVNSLHFSNNTTLEMLDLSLNEIVLISKKPFNYLKLLDTLKLDSNKIVSIEPGSLSGMDELVHLNLSHNAIASLGYGTFSGLKNLRTLDLSYNKIREINVHNLYGLPWLSFLLVDGNLITDINFNEFDGTRINTISLGDNPLHCKILIDQKIKFGEYLNDAYTSPDPEFHPIHMTEDRKHISVTANAITANRQNVDGITCTGELLVPDAHLYNSNTSPNSSIYNTVITNNLLREIKTILNSSQLNSNQMKHIVPSDDLSKQAIQNMTNINERLLEKMKSFISNVTPNRDVWQRIEDVFNASTQDIDIQTKIYNEIKQENSHVNDILKYFHDLVRSNNTLAGREFEKEASPPGEGYPNRTADAERLKAELKEIVAKEIKSYLAESVQAYEKVLETHLASNNYLKAELKGGDNDSAPVHYTSKFTEVCVGIILAIMLGVLLYTLYAVKSKRIFPTIRSSSTQEMSNTIDM